MLARPTHPSADAVGDWRFCDLWSGPAWAGAPQPPDAREVRAALPHLVERVEATFAIDSLAIARIFSVRREGFIRPHRDWLGGERAFTRLHVPLATDATCRNAEDAIVYHMGVGEIWCLDGARVHSGGCFSQTTRLHLVLDFAPDVPIERLFRAAATVRAEPPSPIPRVAFGPEQRAAVTALAAICDDATFAPIADLLAALHFGHDVDAAAGYAWLEEVATNAGRSSLAARARALREKYVGRGAG